MWSNRAPTYAWKCTRCGTSNLPLIASCVRCGTSAFARGSELLQPSAAADVGPPRGLPRPTYRLVGLLAVLHGFAPASVLGMTRYAGDSELWSAFLLVVSWPLWLIPLSKRGENSLWSQLMPVGLSLIALAPVTPGVIAIGVMLLTGMKT